MMYPAAVALGIRLRVLAGSTAESAARVVPEPVLGDCRDAAVLAAFAQLSDVLTVADAQVSVAALEKLEADGVVVRPSPAALAYVQDPSVAMRRRLTEFGEEVAGHEAGQGVARRRELAALVARSPSGQGAAWPVAERVRVAGTGDEVIAPAPGLDPALAARATEVALRIAGELGVVGVLAVELSEVVDPSTELDGTASVVVDDLAMRPHDAGRWTVDGAVTSQFEQHLRAVLDLPLGDPRPRAPWSVTVDVLGCDYPDLYRSYLHVMAHDPGVKVHLYGKDVSPGTVVGHVTVCGEDLDDVRARARHAADFIAGVIDK